MDKNCKIFIAGHSGMVGSAILNNLTKRGYKNIIVKNHKELDLINQNQTKDFFKSEKPDCVILAAAKVGGILANNNFRGQFIYENLSIQNNVIHFSHKFKVKKLIFLGSACIYPKLAKQPMKEKELLSGYLEYTNEPYAIAKIAGIKLCESYFKQYDDDFFSIMPNNLYGENDNFNIETSHVIPALINKIHNAKSNSKNHVQIWGTGNPLREFMHVKDLAEAVVFLLNNISASELYGKRISHINVGTGEEISIKNLAHLIKRIIGFKGDLVFNQDMPDGVPRKLLDASYVRSLGWSPKINLESGLKSTYDFFRRTL